MFFPKQTHFITFLGSIFLSISSVQAFSDIMVTDPLYPATTYLEQHDIFTGYEDGSFGREKLINRVEALKVILTAAEIDTNSPSDNPKIFSDVPEGAWFKPFVDKASNLDIVSGNAGGETFSPGRTVNKAEFLKMLFEAFKVNPSQYDLSEISITDVPNDAWFADYFKFAVAFNILSTDTSNQVKPAQELTRGAAAAIIFSTLRQGQGLEVQTLLNLAEVHLLKNLELLQTQDLVNAQVINQIAMIFSNYALTLLPENPIVQSSEATAKSLQALTIAIEHKNQSRWEQTISEAKKAWAEADRSAQLNENNQNFAQNIKTIASRIADEARAAQQDS